MTAKRIITDHGEFDGLADDDHVQYLLVNGTRAMTGNLNMDGNDVANVNDIDINGLLDLNAKMDADLDNVAQAGETFVSFAQTWSPVGGNGTGTQLGWDMTQQTSIPSVDYQNMIGMRFLQFHSQAGSSISQMFGLRFQAIIGGVFATGDGSAANVYANETQVFVNTTGTVGQGVGNHVITDHRGSGAMTDCIGQKIVFKKGGGGSTSTTTNLTALQIERSYNNAAWTVGQLKAIWIRSLGKTVAATYTNPPIAIDIADQDYSGTRGIRFGAATYIFEFPTDNTGNATAAVGRVPVYHNGSLQYIRLYND